MTLSLSCTKSTRVRYFALGGKNLGVLTIRVVVTEVTANNEGATEQTETGTN